MTQPNQQCVQYRGPRPFALRPLLRWTGAPCDTLAGEVLGLGLGDAARQAVQRRKRMGLTEAEADVLAVRAGVHPSAVWPDWWTLTLEPV